MPLFPSEASGTVSIVIIQAEIEVIHSCKCIIELVFHNAQREISNQPWSFEPYSPSPIRAYDDPRKLRNHMLFMYYRLKKWLEFCHLEKDQLKQNYLLCTEHFRDEDYKNHTRKWVWPWDEVKTRATCRLFIASHEEIAICWAYSNGWEGVVCFVRKPCRTIIRIISIKQSGKYYNS